MSPTKRLLVTLTVGSLAWWLASHWYINASECFYSAVPVIALTFWLTGRSHNTSTTGTAALRYQREQGLRSGIAMILAVIILGVCSMSWANGPRVLYSWRYWLEFVTMLYQTGAVFIVIFSFLRLMLKLTNLLARRFPDNPILSNVLAPAAALSVFILVAVPFGVAYSFVFRVKFPNVVDPKTELSRPYENVEFACADGTVLSGWWVPARLPSLRTIIFCHGLAANRTQTLRYHEIGDWLGANMFFFDLRGHGDSGGRGGSLGQRERDDVLSAIAFVRQQWPSQSRQVIGMGISLGAAVLADVGAEVEPPLDGFILDSGFTATGEMTHSLPPFFRGWLLTVGLPMANWNAGCTITDFRPVDSIGRVRAPVVLIHSLHDFITPSEHSARLYERAVEPKQLVILDVDGHTNAYFDRHADYQAAIRRFAERLPR